MLIVLLMDLKREKKGAPILHSSYPRDFMALPFNLAYAVHQLTPSHALAEVPTSTPWD